MKHLSSTMAVITYKNQQGATLIVVLLVLILITLVGVIVVRKSGTDLRLATASQIDSVLFIAAEQPNANLEKETQKPSTKLFSETEGMIGYFMSDINTGNAEHKLVTCFRPQSNNPFDFGKLAVFNDKNTNNVDTGRLDSNAKTPFCHVGNPKDYTSSRNATLTQMTVKRGASIGTGGSRFVNAPLDVDIGSSRTKNYSIDVETVSALPAYSSTDKVDECFAPDKDEKTEACLSDKGVPSKAISQNYIAKFQDNIEEAGT